MHVNEVENKAKLQSIILNLLKDYGIKHNKERKTRAEQKKSIKRLFGVHLQHLELADVILADGSVVQIPRFMADACNRILENVEVEGIFRKAGSTARQRDIRASLENGSPLGRTHHVIDIGNVLKYFIRELPEPLIPTNLQQTLQRCFLIGENRINAILLSCLLLPALEANTLAFFMQFLLTISLSADHNKMTAENLAILFTPGIMPCFNVNSARFTNNVKTVQILIENANAIGIVPELVCTKLNFAKKNMRKSLEFLDNVVKNNKHKRRTEIFTGLKKMVGSSRNNLMDLEETPMKNNKPSRTNVNEQSALRSSKKKRKFADPIYTFSGKKNKDIVPNTPSTPLARKAKVPRRSLGGARFMKNIISQSINPVSSAVERRWSLVGSSWSKPQLKPFYSSIETKLPTISDKTLNSSLDDFEHREILDTTEEKVSENDEHDNLNKNKRTNGVAEDEVDSMPVQEKLEQSDDSQLAHGLHNKLRIRCQQEDMQLKKTRSPRVRKIGTQRNHDKTRLTRTQTWHMSSSGKAAVTELVNSNRNITVPTCKRKQTVLTTNNKVEDDKPVILTPKINHNVTTEDWTPADCFFTPAKSTVCTQLDTENVKSLKFIDGTPFQTPKTPKRLARACNTDRSMLPPTSFTVQKLRTPKTSTFIAPTNGGTCTPSVDENGRASIARLRTQNAGMVMAKAKLFDGLVDSSGVNVRRTQPTKQVTKGTPRRRENSNLKLSNTPKSSVKSKNLHLTEL